MKERGLVEKLWREEKYHVLLHSQQHYNYIRQRLKSDISLTKLEQLINQALELPPTTGSVINAYDHMWGYFKNIATTEEKRKAQDLKQRYVAHDITYSDLLYHLAILADKYDVTYLQQSTVLINEKDR